MTASEVLGAFNLIFNLGGIVVVIWIFLFMRRQTALSTRKLKVIEESHELLLRLTKFTEKEVKETGKKTEKTLEDIKETVITSNVGGSGVLQ